MQILTMCLFLSPLQCVAVKVVDEPGYFSFFSSPYLIPLLDGNVVMQLFFKQKSKCLKCYVELNKGPMQ